MWLFLAAGRMVTVGDRRRLIHHCKESRNKLGTLVCQDTVAGVILWWTMLSPVLYVSLSMDPGIMLLAEMHRNTFPLIFKLEVPCRNRTWHPWPLAGITIVLSAKKFQISGNWDNFLSIFSLVFVFCAYLCSRKKSPWSGNLFLSNSSHNCETCC